MPASEPVGNLQHCRGRSLYIAMSPGAAAGWHRCAAAPWPCGPVRRPGPQDGGSRGGASCSAATARGALPAGDVAELGAPVGGAAGRWPSPRAWRCAGIITWWATRSDGLASRGGIADRNALQCCNRSRYPAGQQPQPLPGGARSDPAGVLLGHGDGHVPGRDGRQRPSPGGRRARRPGSQERAAVLQPLEVPRWPAAPASPWWCEI